MPTIVHFDIASDHPQRAKKFYESLFGWKIMSPPGINDYFMIETEDLEGNPSVGGGLGKRGDPLQRITAYFGVENLDETLRKVEIFGGQVIHPKTSVPGFGYLAVCADTEGNTFGIFEDENKE